jgi:methanol dehydrogenase (cytochrome c) subunit 2
MNASRLLNRLATVFGVAAVLSLGASLDAFAAGAYNGQHCTEPGVCWQPQGQESETIAGSKYDLSKYEDPTEVAKQGDSERAMEQRNAKRAEYLKKTGKFIYDVSQIPE